MNFIYYSSDEYVDRLYRATGGEIGSRTQTKETDVTASISSEAGLAEMIAWIAKLQGKGEFEVRKHKGETVEVQQSAMDRTDALLLALKNKVPRMTADARGLMWYSQPIKLRSLRRGDRVVIEIAGESERVSFVGETSAKLWRSQSLTNNLLVAAKKSPDKCVPTFGLVWPVAAISSAGRVHLQVQFIVIASPDTWTE